MTWEKILVATPPLIFVLVPVFTVVMEAVMVKKTVLHVLMTVMIVVQITVVTINLVKIMIPARRIVLIIALFFVWRIVTGIHVFMLQTVITAYV
jgi:hypothetical protein